MIKRDYVVVQEGAKQTEASEWREVTLGDLIDIKHGFAFKGSSIHDDPQGDILLTPGNFRIGGGFKGDKFKYYDGPMPEEFVLSEGDLLVSMTDLSKQSDTLGYPALVPSHLDGRRYLHNQRLGKISLYETRQAFMRYIYYLLCSAEYRSEVLASATGTTVKHTSPERIKQFRFMLPPLPEQRTTAHILGTIDDKIELNRRMNETLEEMARALFKSWFVDFDPVRAKMESRDTGLPPDLAALFPDRLVDSELGLIPEGWEVRALGEVADVTGGRQLDKAALRANGPVPVLGGAGLMGYTDMHNAEGFVITMGRVGAYCGQFVAYRGKVWVNNNASRISPKDSVPSVWFLLALKNLDTDVIRRGAAQPFISNSDLAAVRIVQPGESVMSIAQRTFESMMRLSEHAQQESRSLAAQRDALLPRLMSGELALW